MAHPVMNLEECVGCGICIDLCPQDVFVLENDIAIIDIEDACIGCEECVEECPTGAITEIAEG